MLWALHVHQPLILQGSDVWGGTELEGDLRVPRWGHWDEFGDLRKCVADPSVEVLRRGLGRGDEGALGRGGGLVEQHVMLRLVAGCLPGSELVVEPESLAVIHVSVDRKALLVGCEDCSRRGLEGGVDGSCTLHILDHARCHEALGSQVDVHAEGVCWGLGGRGKPLLQHPSCPESGVELASACGARCVVLMNGSFSQLVYRD